ncbi:MAG: hypothetical protein ABIN37_09955 [Burkholderiaceae bacterium]
MAGDQWPQPPIGLYDLKRLDKHRAMLARGKIPMGTDVAGLQW